MKDIGLSEREQKLVCDVFRRHPEVEEAQIFGSRAKGNFKPNSDVDIALGGKIDLTLLARIAGELDELPLPYIFDVQSLGDLRHNELKDHIQRVGVVFYKAATQSLA